MNPTKAVDTILEQGVLAGYRHEGNANRRAVLFVHGFIGTAEDTWTAGGGWPTFLQLIAEDPLLTDFDVFAFSYPTTLFSGASIDNIARQLTSVLESKLENKQIVFIAHSMGGLVCMQYVLNRLKHGRPLNMLGLLMYGTPTTGTELVKIAQIMAFGLGIALPWLGRVLSFLMRKNRQIAELGTASKFLDEIHDQWALRVVNGGDPTLAAKLRAWLPVRVVTGNEDWVVSERSGKGVYGEIDWHPTKYGHKALVKPERRDDTRYRQAADFLKKCREAKEGRVLTSLREISDSVWRAQEGKFIRAWKYDVEIHAQGGQLQEPMLNEGGYSLFVVKKCQYRMVLHEQEIRIAISFGEIAQEQTWNKQPAYVHQIKLNTIAEAERGRCAEAFDKVLNAYKPEKAWEVFFHELNVTISDNTTRFPLNGGQVERIGSSLLRTFPLPDEAMGCLGEEVTFDLTYRSVAPQALTSFFVMFPWLTDQATAQVTVLGQLKFLSFIPRLASDKDVSIQAEKVPHKGEALVKATNLVLPGSSVEFRWER